MGFGPCMCGDIQCSSCGQAQGNWRCPLCNTWVDDGCIHVSAKTGTIKKRYQKQVEEKAKAEWEAETRLAKDLEEENRLAELFWAQEGT